MNRPRDDMLAVATSAAASSMLNPVDAATLNMVSICAGNVNVQQDPRFATLLPAQAQTLPLDYCSSWPIWVVQTSASAKLPVARIPGPEGSADPLGGWVPPAAFEQLWLPEDLPQPKARAAIGLVLRNGDPRYIFPTYDAFLETSDGTVWRNRGLNSVPLAKTWLHFGEIPPESLRMSAYSALPLPTASDEAADAGTTSSAGDDGDSAVGNGESGAVRVGAYERVLANTEVHVAIDAAFDALQALPPVLRKTSLGDGFSYLIVPLTPEATAAGTRTDVYAGEDGLYLPPTALSPGGRLRAFLSEEGADQDRDAWQRGELDLTMWRLPPGKDSPYMQDQYRPLYNHAWS